MNPITIQDYVAGRLSGQELAEFEAQKQGNAALQAEIDSYRQFQAKLREAGQSEYAPNLQPALSSVARQKSNHLLPKFASVAIAGFAILAIGIAFNRVLQDQTNPTIVSAKALPTEAHLQSKSRLVMHWDGSNPNEGADKIRTTFYRAIPTIDLTNLPGAEFAAAECGSCWINFKYVYKGDTYNIYGRCEEGNLVSGNPISVGNQTLFIFSDAVGWYDTGKMTYVCNGGTAANRLVVAKAAAKQTARLR